MRFFRLLIAACVWCGCSSPDAPDTSTNNDTAAACAGCVLAGTDECVNGDSPSACGADGAACSVCDSGFCAESGVCVEPPSCGPGNCQGCCDAQGLCVEGEDQDRCGNGGLACEDCASTATCEAGVCVQACGPDTCAGCCSPSGLCVPGDADDGCGRGGGSCANCSTLQSVCSEGLCVAPDCAATCTGCCSGSDCIVVPIPAQCGAAGMACVDCGTGRTCSMGGCVVAPSGQWTITVTTGVVLSTDTDGESWDTLNGLPDPLVEVEVAGQVGTTAEVMDSLAPAWNEDVLTVTGGDLFGGLILRYLDSDVAINDTICEITVALDDESPAFNGAVVESVCPQQAGSFVRWRLTPR